MLWGGLRNGIGGDASWLMLPSVQTLWLLMLRGREYSASAQGGMHATPLWLIYGPGRPPLYLCFRLASHGSGNGSTLCPTLCCCLLAPTDMHRLDQLPACWGLIEAIGHGCKQGTGREHSRPLQWLHLTLHSLHACHYMHSTSYLSSLPSLTPCKASLSFLLQTCSRSACDLTLE